MNLRRTYPSLTLIYFNIAVNFLMDSNKEQICSPRTMLQNMTTQFQSKIFIAISDEIRNNTALTLNQKSISFVVSPYWLQFLLIMLSNGSSDATRDEIERTIRYKWCKNNMSDSAIEIMKYVMENIPSSQFLEIEVRNFIFVRADYNIVDDFHREMTELNVTIDGFNTTQPDVLSEYLNSKIKMTTDKRMKDIFDEVDFVDDEPKIIIVNSVYYKNKWLYPPTVLNGTSEFYLSSNATPKLMKMFRINGIMPFADMIEFNAKVVEVPYDTNNLSMLVYLPNTIDGLIEMEEKIMMCDDIIVYTDRMLKPISVSITLPSYSLRSTLLMKSKLKQVNISRIFSNDAEMNNMIEENNVSISHMVQRLKLWANQGKDAFKDTGEEKIPKPIERLIANHPFFFILRMNNVALMLGHFYH